MDYWTIDKGSKKNSKKICHDDDDDGDVSFKNDFRQSMCAVQSFEPYRFQ